MTRAALNNLATYIQSLNLSKKNREWLASKIIEPEAPPTERSWAELDERIAEAHKALAEGRCYEMKPGESGEDFLNRILCIQ